MWESLIAGIWLGMSISLLIGPLFLTLLDTTIERGKVAGIAVAMGIWASDVLLATASFYSLRSFAEQTSNQQLVGYAGSSILTIFGIILFSTRYEKKPVSSLKYNTLGKYWLRGFVINSLNPFTILLWISMATAKVDGPYSPANRVLFYFGLLGMVAIGDVIKVFLAGKLKTWLSESGINLFRKFSGAAICIFGIILLIRTILL